MTYGVVCTRATVNIGDDIQSLAAIDLLHKNDVTRYTCVEREELNNYKGEPLALIMNGWFLHNLQNFPPSDKIKPLFISFHCEYEEIVREHRKYFQKHEPIGCRSLSTVSMFHKYGIEAHLDGCITLCFDEFPEKEDYICVSDVDSAFEGAFRNGPDIDYWVDWSKDFDRYKNIIYLTHHKGDLVKQQNQQRLARAETLLDLYKGARLVVTSRLHALLPCRAFNTNAKFVHPYYNSDKRFSGLENIINTRNFEGVGLDGIPSTADRTIINQKKESLHRTFKTLLEQA